MLSADKVLEAIELIFFVLIEYMPYLLLFLGFIGLILVALRFINSKSDDRLFVNIIKFLENEVALRYGKNKKEKDYQDDLFHRFAVLTERHGYNIGYESVKGKHRVDFSVDDKIGIELKVHRGGAKVEKELFSQITDYAKYYEKMIGLVLNGTDASNEDLKQEIKTKLKEQNVIDKNNYEIVVISI